MFNHAKRVWMITDLHFGVRSNSREWMEIQRDYFFDFFLPLVNKERSAGDMLLILGDVYDNRQAIGLPVMKMGLEIFDELVAAFPDGVVTFVGNHDVWGKNSNEINSLEMFKKVKGLTIYTEPTIVNFGRSKFLIMPWRKDHAAEAECLKQFDGQADYLACHSDIQGAKFNKSVTIEEGCDISCYSSFKKVYTGHIHYSQDIEPNIRLLGCPYQMTRLDSYNRKGVTILDLATGKDRFIENNFSPRFIRVGLNEMLDMTPVQAKKVCRNNFVDITVDSQTALRAPLSMLVDLLDNSYRKIDFQVVSKSQALPDVEVEVGTGFDFVSLMESYVKEMPYEDETKGKVFESLKKLHKMAEQKT